MLALFHPDYTVGSGIGPDLLTFQQNWKRSRASGISACYRRWGITPRPENVHVEYRHAAAQVNPCSDKTDAKDDDPLNHHPFIFDKSERSGILDHLVQHRAPAVVEAHFFMLVTRGLIAVDGHGGIAGAASFIL
jgi:hypothetical protein